uniref:Uncharacterized protein n=1 Tax=Steinernema glaseri TaxID=37863 RepID=A0A1I7Y3Z1_9BILA
MLDWRRVCGWNVAPNRKTSYDVVRRFFQSTSVTPKPSSLHGAISSSVSTLLPRLPVTFAALRPYLTSFD